MRCHADLIRQSLDGATDVCAVVVEVAEITGGADDFVSDEVTV